MTTVEFRVTTDGREHRPVAFVDSGGGQWAAVSQEPDDDCAGHGPTPRAAVLSLCARVGWDVREILAPGELSAEERVAAERARCAAVCREVAARHYCDRVSRSEGATECAEAIELGEVGDG